MHKIEGVHENPYGNQYGNPSDSILNLKGINYNPYGMHLNPWNLMGKPYGMHYTEEKHNIL